MGGGSEAEAYREGGEKEAVEVPEATSGWSLG